MMPRPSIGKVFSDGTRICSQCATRYASASKRRRLHSTSKLHQTQPSILSTLEERGLVNQIAGDRNGLEKLLRTPKVGIYAGIDPTAPSLHLGHLLPLMVLFWLHHHGYHTFSLLGAATAKVGDPSGRLISRATTTEAVMDENFRSMNEQVQRIWRMVSAYGQRHGKTEGQTQRQKVLDNGQWLKGLNILHFLKTMGNGMRLGAMLGRDTVRNKMEKGDGMSFAEFTYPLLQAWDWWEMYRKDKVLIQVGGSDQYGNIVAGMDAVKYIVQHAAAQEDQAWLDDQGRLREEQSPMGLTVPLLTTSSGEKFGKSAGNAIWLDPALTSPFDLYGFLLRSADDDVERYLRLFTFISIPDITALMLEHGKDPGKRIAQHALASEVLELVHGPEQAAKTRSQHQEMRAPSILSLLQSSNSSSSLTKGPDEVSSRVDLPRSLVHKTPLARILYHAGLADSKSAGARMITKGGVYVGNPDPLNEGSTLQFLQANSQEPFDESFLSSRLLVVRLGKWKTHLIFVKDDETFEQEKLDAPGWADWKARHRTGGSE